MAANAMPRDRIFALRETIARLEGKPLSGLDDPSADVADAVRLADRSRASAPSGKVSGGDMTGLESLFPGGLPSGSLIEIRSQRLKDAGVASGFTLALGMVARQASSHGGACPDAPLMWIGDRQVTREAGLPYAAGLQDFGLLPGMVFHAVPRRLEDALWLAEAALSCRAFAAVILEVNGNPRAFGLTESRRLSLKARATGGRLLLLRQSGEEEASSALVRLRVEPAPSCLRLLPGGSALEGSIGNPVFRLSPEKNRGPAPDDLTLEWNVHDRVFRSVDLSAGRHAGECRRQAHPGGSFSPSGDRPDRPQALGTVVAFKRAS